ncbi:hypothetical protein BZG36_04758 [Bifiguratus adelaidae]|uniref:CsbD-like domain-containing protein n=1 Tax=Bifiguratus adelaidae TaxID=1938954 RepID=A0A261XV24_9FUNG|nr:hypothetical protein BZG36_04758 [Bifiguratus adelaidae]
MSEPTRTSGQTDSTFGNVKQNVGSALGNESMQAKGAAQQTHGDAEYKGAQNKQYGEGFVDKVTGGIKDAVGSLTGNHSMQAEGKGDKAQGDTKKAASNY